MAARAKSALWPRDAIIQHCGQHPALAPSLRVFGMNCTLTASRAALVSYFGTQKPAA
jgi:hypothetical protein